MLRGGGIDWQLNLRLGGPVESPASGSGAISSRVSRGWWASHRDVVEGMCHVATTAMALTFAAWSTTICTEVDADPRSVAVAARHCNSLCEPDSVCHFLVVKVLRIFLKPGLWPPKHF